MHCVGQHYALTTTLSKCYNGDNMFMFGIFTWWYGAGWIGTMRSARRRMSDLAATFSLGILLRTLFAPWRRVVTYPGAGLDARFRAMGDNLISRCVGFTVRFFVLLAAGVAFVVLATASMLEFVVWPLIPIAAIVLIIKGLL